MSVYTIVSASELEDFLRRYAVGTPYQYHGINEGIENTNYFVDTDSGGRYVLTIFEWQSREDLPYFLDLMTHVSTAGLPCPCPVADREGRHLQILCGKPATLVTRLAGHNLESVHVDHCRQVGAALAALHLATQSFTQKHPDKRGRSWRERTAEKILPKLPADEADLLRDELAQHQNNDIGVPRGTIHADLFRDNVLFDDEQLRGIIDFYYACAGDLIYDLAVAVNDWCLTEDGKIDNPKYLALTEAYAEHRPFLPAEKNAWQNTLRRAALRFWLSRLYDSHFPKSGQITHVKDAAAFRKILLQRRDTVPPLC